MTASARHCFPDAGERQRASSATARRSARGCSASRSRARSISGAGRRRPGRSHTTAPSPAARTGADQSGSGRSRRDAIAALARRRSGQHRAGAGRSGDCLGQRPRSAHLAGGGGVSGSARGARTRTSTPTQVRAAGRRGDRRPHIRALGEPRVNVLELNLALDAQANAGEHDSMPEQQRPDPDQLLAHVQGRGGARAARQAENFLRRDRRRRQDLLDAGGGARRARQPASTSSSATSSRTGASRPSGCSKAWSSCRRSPVRYRGIVRQEFDLDAALEAPSRDSAGR